MPDPSFDVYASRYIHFCYSRSGFLDRGWLYCSLNIIVSCIVEKLPDCIRRMFPTPTLLCPVKDLQRRKLVWKPWIFAS